MSQSSTSRSAPPRASDPPPDTPTLASVGIRQGHDPLLIVCRCFGFLAAGVALLCVAVNVLSAITSFRNGHDVRGRDRSPSNPLAYSSSSVFAILMFFFLSFFLSFCFWKIFGGIFRCYAVALALFVAVAETEWSFIMKFCRILEYWAGRGMLQIFVAVMTRAFPDISGQRQDLVLLQEIASYLLAACGLTYVISGVLCIGFLKRARQHKEITREQAAKDLEGQSKTVFLTITDVSV